MQKLIGGLKREYEASKQLKEQENEAIRERMSQMQAEREEEIQTWQLKKIELENTLSKLETAMNQNLSNHKDATERLKAQLKKGQAACQQREEENKALKGKMHMIK